MQKTTLPINEIKVENRQREDLGDLEELSASLQRYGLIQPIIVNQDKRLIAGGRRLAAATKLGWTDIGVVYKETLSIDELHELELEENVRRKDMSWQERTKNILTIYRLKKARAGVEGTFWGQKETAELLGIKSLSQVSNALRIGELLEKGDKEIAECDSFFEALRLVLRREEEALREELIRRSQASLECPAIALQSPLSDFSIEGATLMPSDESSPPISQAAQKDAMREQYLRNPLNDPNAFDTYYESRLALISKLEEHRNTINLSFMLRCGDSIKLMQDNPSKFDALITDIPYGIDMDMLNQQNPNGQMFDIDTVLEEHDVEGNEELYTRFFPAAFSCLKDNTYLITWCDQMQWQFMFDLATAAGFKVQRWPITWVKAHRCMNQMANVNFTKTTEIAMVCRKGTASLQETDIPCHIIAPHDDYKERLGHPFVKPFAVWEHLIKAVSYQGQLILEPFAGRGSGVISMLRMHRRVVASEINVAHYNALVENVKTYYREINPAYTFI